MIALSQPLNIGILGAANIARLFITGVQPSRKVSVQAVASRDIERGRAFARETGVPRVHATYEALLADPAIEAVYNPLPNNLHAEWTIRAADAGKHVLCEKPLAASAAEVKSMFDAARRNNVLSSKAIPIERSRRRSSCASCCARKRSDASSSSRLVSVSYSPMRRTSG